MNVVRKHLSTIKGGRPAAATKARVVSLIVSDIPGDNPAHVASGPTVPDGSTRPMRLDHPAVQPQAAAGGYRHLNSPRPMRHGRTIRPLAAEHTSSHRPAYRWRQPPNLHVRRESGGDPVEFYRRGIARRGLVHAAIAREVAGRDRPFTKPTVILSGGETTVTLRAKGGKGGRNGEFALALALASTGTTPSMRLPPTPTASTARKTMPAHFPTAVPSSDCAPPASTRAACSTAMTAIGFKAIGDLFETGPTGTNVNDFRAILVR